MKYTINQGRRDYAVRLGVEHGLYLFIHDYAREMGMSMSAAVRRLVLIGARCESEHGNATMPASFDGLRTGTKDFDEEFFGELEHKKRPTKIRDWL